MRETFPPAIATPDESDVTAAPSESAAVSPVSGAPTASAVRRLTRREWTRIGVMAGFVVLLHVLGFFSLFALIAPHHYNLGVDSTTHKAIVFSVGLGITAYTLGLRHAFDADHIAAIDNTTRKLMTDGQRPVSVGFFFSLGHSTIVFLLAVGFTAGIRGLSGAVADDGSWLHTATGLIGPTVS